MPLIRELHQPVRREPLTADGGFSLPIAQPQKKSKHFCGLEAVQTLPAASRLNGVRGLGECLESGRVQGEAIPLPLTDWMGVVPAGARPQATATALHKLS